MKLKILFMGTPEFALFSLKALYDSGESIVGVITQPDRPQGRGYTMTPPPVKVWAEEKGIPVLQPNTLKDESFAQTLAEINPDMIVVVAYGKILPENVINYPEYGCINVHGSYLPHYRGAAPMQRAIIDGASQTGATILYMDKGIDTGDMLARKRIKILPDDNFEDVHDKIGTTGSALLIETIGKIKSGNAKRTRQYGAYSNYASKIEKAECNIDFSTTAQKVYDLIRGLSPVPLSFTHTPDGKLLKIISAQLSESKSNDATPGTVLSVDDGKITVACRDMCVEFTEVLPEGKRKMSAAEFVRGRGVAVGDLLRQ